MKKLLFLHVPKCGGSTFHQILAQNSTEQKRMYPPIDGSYASIERLRATPKEDLERYWVIGGHFFFGIHDLFESPSTYITFLRHPVRRVISNYLFIFQSPKHFLFNTVCPSGKAVMPLKEFVNSNLSLALENQSVLMLGNQGIKLPAFVEDYALRVAKGEGVQVDIPLTDKDWGAMLKQAKANIASHFTCVGLVERFDESLLLMSRKIPLNDIRYEPINATSRKLTLSESEIRDVEESIQVRNRFDMELYQYSERLLEQQLCQAGIRQGSDRCVPDSQAPSPAP